MFFLFKRIKGADGWRWDEKIKKIPQKRHKEYREKAREILPLIKSGRNYPRVIKDLSDIGEWDVYCQYLFWVEVKKDKRYLKRIHKENLQELSLDKILKCVYEIEKEEIKYVKNFNNYCIYILDRISYILSIILPKECDDTIYCNITTNLQERFGDAFVLCFYDADMEYVKYRLKFMKEFFQHENPYQQKKLSLYEEIFQEYNNSAKRKANLKGLLYNNRVVMALQENVDETQSTCYRNYNPTHRIRLNIIINQHFNRH